MAIPLQYQSQFIPTDFGTVGQLTNLYARDMANRDQLFDQSFMAGQEAINRIAEMTTSDPEMRNKLMEDLSNRIQDTVTKKGGDYGAAAKDITRIIAKERSNPWYQFDTAKLQAMQDYNRMQNQLGINFYSANDPSQVTLDQYLSDPTSLQFQAINVGDLKNLAAAKAKEYATANKQFINRGVGNLMREVGWQLGMGDEQKAQQYLQENPEFIDDILQAHGIDDPNLRAMMEQSALTGLVGERDTRFMQDYEAIQNLESAEESNTGFIPITPGINTNIKNDRPFNTVQELNNIPKEDPRYIMAQKVKTTAFNSLSQEDQQTINDLGGEEAVSELSELYEGFNPLSGLSKATGDLVALLGGLGSFVKAGVEGYNNPIGASLAFSSAKEKWDKIKSINSPLDSYVERKKELQTKYNLDSLSRKERKNVLLKSSIMNNRLNSNINKEIKASYGDLLGNFFSHDYLTGNIKRDKEVEAIYKRLNSKVETIPFDNFTIISTNSNIDFTDKDKLRKKENEDYLYSTSKGHYRILETTVNSDLGPIYLIETDRKGGGTDVSIATLENVNLNRNLLNSYGKNNIPTKIDENGNITEVTDFSSKYEDFLKSENTKKKFRNSLANLPLYKDFKGNTVGEYLRMIRQDPTISREEEIKVQEFLASMGADISFKLK